MIFLLTLDLRGQWPPVDELWPTTGAVTVELDGVGNEVPIEFGVIGDYGYGNVSATGRVAAMMHGWLPDFVCTTGDNCYFSLDPDYIPSGQTMSGWKKGVGQFFGRYVRGRQDQLYAEQTSAVARFFPVVGNHDSLDNASLPLEEFNGGNGGTIAGYLKYFHEDVADVRRLPVDRGAVHNSAISYYAVRKGPVDFFMLDSDAYFGAFGAQPDFLAMKAWFAAALADSTARWRVVFFHHSPFSSLAGRNHPFMEWDELAQVDAIFCGHDHVYERLRYKENGPPIFITGNGATLYAFNAPNVWSQKRYNSALGALRVVADRQQLRVESRALPDEQIVVEKYQLGLAEAAGTEEARWLYLDKNTTLLATTSEPLPEGDPKARVRLELHDAVGTLMAQVEANAANGRSARLSRALVEAGWYRLTAQAVAGTQGQVSLQVSTSAWQRRLEDYVNFYFGGGPSTIDLQADPDGDGVVNLLEYALDTDPLSATAPWETLFSLQKMTPSRWQLNFSAPATLPAGHVLVVETSTDMTAQDWSPLIEHQPYRPWSGAVPVTVQPQADGRLAVQASVPASLIGPGRYFRVRVKTAQ
jgi:tartrate-resistant acid phosphatase type 5